jgi:NAD(P)-dependent dehydrogenase (short-subunit alcohol dehydrogenase family)
MATRPGAALVTGAGRRVGRAFALRLAETGFPVIVHARHADEEAAETVGMIQQAGGRAAVIAADLADRNDLSTLVDRAQRPFGPLALLVNSASVFHDDRMGSITGESWDLHFTSNLHAPVMLAQAFAAQAADLPAGADPSIVNIIDQRVLKPNPQFFSYSLSKAALYAATRTMAQALAPTVRVNGIGPGPTLASIHQSAESFAAEVAATLLHRGSAPEELAEALLYLVDARAVTGQMIAVDGGQHLNWLTPDIIEP